MDSRHILGMRVDATSYADTCAVVSDWSRHGTSRYVCVATVNNVMESVDSTVFREVMNAADLVTPDGMPLVWGLRLLGVKTATRVYGPDLTLELLKLAESERIPIGLYGASPAALGRLCEVVQRRFPAIDVAYRHSPPFRALTPDEDAAIVDAVNRSGARILFVGLSTPKQDYWMAAHRGRIHAVMLGVGAAFDFVSGDKAQAPRWMMGIGLEWLFRLVTEPRRLWKRYFRHNPRFLLLFGAQVFRHRTHTA